MKAGKLLLLMACALALQGCFVYTNPYEPTGRIQYDGRVDHDPYAYDQGEPVVDVSIADAAYYPWWSIDYYYLGSHYYQPAYLDGLYSAPGYGYGGVPPYYWSYYGFYSPFYYPYASYAWYDPWYGWPRYGIGLDIFWTHVYWNTRYQAHAEEHYYPPSDNQYGVSRYGYRERDRDALSDARDRAYASERLQLGDLGGISRNVSMAPSPGNTDAGMEIRSRRDRKIKDSRIGPAPVQFPSSTSRLNRTIPYPPPGSSMPAQSAPGMVRQVTPPQAQSGPAVRPPSPSAPVASTPRMVRQQPAPQVRRSAPAPGPAPIRSPAGASPGDRGSSAYPDGSSRRRN